MCICCCGTTPKDAQIKAQQRMKAKSKLHETQDKSGNPKQKNHGEREGFHYLQQVQKYNIKGQKTTW